MTVFNTPAKKLTNERNANNIKIAELLKRNLEIDKELEKYLFAPLTPEQKERYDKELASDKWKDYTETTRYASILNKQYCNS